MGYGIEFVALLIPAGVLLVLRHYRPDRIAIWEVLLPLLPILFVVMAVKHLAISSVMQHTERHGCWVVSTHYYEDWDEYISQTCTRTVSCGKDCTTTETYDCSYVAYHPEYWTVIDSTGRETEISKEWYDELVRRFGGRATFRDLGRNYHSDDGDEYFANYPGTAPTFTPFFHSFTYENRVQAARGVFHFDPPSADEIRRYQLHAYPDLADHFNDPAVLGAHPQREVADAIIQRANASLGAAKQVRIWVLLFNNQPYAAGPAQEAHWVGAQNNELVVAINYVAGKPTWVYPFCWSPDGYALNDEIKIRVRNQIMATTDLPASMTFLVEQVAKDWRRKPKQEWAYLIVELPTWGWVVSLLLSSLATAGAAYWAWESPENETKGRHPFRVRKF